MSRKENKIKRNNLVRLEGKINREVDSAKETEEMAKMIKNIK